MLELGVGADIVRGVGAILWGILALALLVALVKPKSIKAKALSCLLVLGIFFGPMVPGAMRAHEYKQRYAKAKALFDERCKTAGEKIYRTVEGVEGLLLMKVRPEKINFSDQYAMDDPYGTDYSGDGYPSSMLWGRNEKGELRGTVKGGNTYKFVVARSKDKDKYLRYELGEPKSNGEFETIKTSTSNAPRFGVTFEDLSKPIDRENWIAGSRLQVVDSTNGDVLGERIGWMLDPALGDTSGGRSPWAFAAYNACPSFPKLHERYPVQEGQTRNFVEKILKPI